MSNEQAAFKFFSLQCHISLMAGNIHTVADMGWSLWGGGSSWVFCLVSYRKFKKLDLTYVTQSVLLHIFCYHK